VRSVDGCDVPGGDVHEPHGEFGGVSREERHDVSVGREPELYAIVQLRAALEVVAAVKIDEPNFVIRRPGAGGMGT
jgi:hypothetical protein